MNGSFSVFYRWQHTWAAWKMFLVATHTLYTSKSSFNTEPILASLHVTLWQGQLPGRFAVRLWWENFAQAGRRGWERAWSDPDMQLT